MKVFKFGGTSVGSAERMAQVAEIINDGDQKIVVLSAMSGTTNALVGIGESLYAKDTDAALQKVKELHENYKVVLSELYRSEELLVKSDAFISEKFEQLKAICQNNFGPIEERVLLAQGELISTQLFQFYLEENGIASALLPALSFMRIDRVNEPDMFYIQQNVQRVLDENEQKPIYITQGYICLNAYGEIDNLQRGGSDYTATLIGSALKADEVQIWTDIDGLHNNDPRVVENTRPVSQLSYSEAEELAFFGAKILHPQCVMPSSETQTPVWLKNTMDPQAHGTLITTASGTEGVKAVAAKDNITAIKIKSGRMMMAYGFLRRIFEVFERFQTPIDMITTSEVAVSLTIDDTTNLSQILDELRKFGSVLVDEKQTIVSVVGHNLVEDPRSVEIFSAIQGLPTRMISYGGSKNNISLLIDSQYKTEVLRNLSEHLFQ